MGFIVRYDEMIYWLTECWVVTERLLQAGRDDSGLLIQTCFRIAPCDLVALKCNMNMCSQLHTDALRGDLGPMSDTSALDPILVEAHCLAALKG